MAQMNTDIAISLNKLFEVDLPENISLELLTEKLAAYINLLVQTDFQKLVSLLYRVDVGEAKLKYLLNENGRKDAGKIIAELIIERQLQKIKSRQQFGNRDENIDDIEKW